MLWNIQKLFDSDADRLTVLQCDRKQTAWFEMQNTDQDRRRCDTVVAIRIPTAVRAALERAARRDLCSISDVIRRATLDRLRDEGLIEEPRP
jgi:hypothetical protein